MEQQPYRWSPEVERQFVSLARVGAKAPLIVEQIGCSERMARRLLARYRAGLPLNTARVGKSAKSSASRRRTPSRPLTSPGTAWQPSIAIMGADAQQPYRDRVLDRAARGWDARRISGAVKVPLKLVLEWLGQAPAPVVAPAKQEPYRRPGEHVAGTGWPLIVRDHDDWPADARFEDDHRALRREPLWRPARVDSDRMSYCSSAASWAAL